MNRIKQAIDIYNEKKPVDEIRMTQKRLSEIIMHDYPISLPTKQQLMVWWIQEERKIDIEILRRLCQTLDMSADFIIGV